MDGTEKLRQDLEILTAMAAGMSQYLLSKTMFQMLQRNMPQLTLGGYLMRQHRLLALQDIALAEVEQNKLAQAIDLFEQALVGKGAYFEQKCQRELDSRLRQWGEYLNEVERDQSGNADFYPARVEIRAMITTLCNALPVPTSNSMTRLVALDDRLGQIWRAGQFVWPSTWQPVYPSDTFWWLYGSIAKSA